MKVIAINGSPHEKGNTYNAIKIVFEELESENIESEIIHVGNKNISGCLACGKCFKNKDEKCVIKDDIVNESIQKMKNADGIILGSAVHYASITGNMKSFLDRVFYVSGANKNIFRHKVGASLVAVRRAGGLTAFNELNNYLNYSEMIIPTSNYWNVIYGTRPGEALKDEEGVQIMRILGKNIAWLLKVLKNSNIKKPELERKQATNFIR
ncbi:MAG: flavodoxin family protein [Thermotogota bacterium]